MEAKRSDDNEPNERLYSVLMHFLESAERGAPTNRAQLLTQHPDLALELEEFLDTWVRVEDLTEPLRTASQALQQAAVAGHSPQPEDKGSEGTALPATRLRGSIGEPVPITVGPLREDSAEEGGWLGRWLRQHPPLVGPDYPFLAAHRPEEIGRLGPYRLLEVIGSGGMGVVFRGEDVQLQRQVAVKVLRAELAADSRFRERFLREARSAASVDHENVIAVYHVGEDGGVPFLGMQWLRGISLEELLRRAGQLSAPAVARLGRQIALGLAAAHAKGLLHRDIKPANLWIELGAPGSVAAGAEESAAAEGRVKILDFGLVRAVSDDAQLTVIGTTVGTPSYMAPEQATGASVDDRCDLFSLGVVLYRMCTGRLPFPTKYSGGVAGPVTLEPPPAIRDLNPAVPPGLADLIMKLLSADPANRPSSAAEVAERIQSSEVWQAVPASIDKASVSDLPATTSPGPIGKGSARRWGLFGLMALVVLVSLAYQFGGIVIRFATNQGEVVIAVDDPDTEVTVSERGAVILDRKGQRRISLAAGEHELEVSVKDASGELCLPFKKTIVLTRGGREIVNVHEELANVAAKSNSTVAKDPRAPAFGGNSTREVALRALSLGGKLKLLGARGEKFVNASTELPAGDFQLIGLDLSRTKATDSALAHLGALRNLHALVLSGSAISSEGLAGVTALENLEDLALDGTQIGDDALTRLTELKHLQRLNLNATGIHDAGLAHLKRLTHLQYLDLADTMVTDAGLANLQPLTDLRSLCLRGAAVGDEGVASLERLTALRELDLNATRVTDWVLARLKPLQDLQSINLTNTRVTDSGVSHLRNLTKLERLSLGGTKVTNAGMAHLSEIKSLLSVDLTQTQVTDEGLAILASNKKLQSLGLRRTPVTDAGLACFAGLTDLIYLDLTSTHVTDSALVSLTGSNGIQYLHLSHTGVTDAGLARLGAMKQLRRLFLAGTRVTDAGLAQVLNLPLPPLDVLDISGTRISATGAAAAKGILPKAQIEWWEPNHRAAETILASGGSVYVRTGSRGSDVSIKDSAALPADYFRVTRARIAGIGKPPLRQIIDLAALTDPVFDDLEEVDLSDSKVSDPDLESLGTLPCRRLVLDRALVRGPGLVYLKSLPRMTELRLGCATLSFLGVRYVGELKQLERLSLAGSGATDASLASLQNLIKLRELDLTGTKVTAEGVASMRRALPMCDIKSRPAGAQ